MKTFALSITAWVCVVVLGACAESNAPSNATQRRPLIEATPKRGLYDQPVTVRLASLEEGVAIRYTTDGSEPTSARSRLYAEPLPIANTTIIRAAAFEGRQRVSAVATHTYVFLDDVLRQPPDPPGFPRGGRAWNGFPSAYHMDPRIVNATAYKPRMKDALRALPAMSIVCDPDDMFGVRRGIYLNSQQRGDDWERACSMELITPDGSAGLQVDCGIQAQGNSVRMPQKTLKHSFRLLFKEEYGPSKLRYPLFQDSPVTNFNTVVLRADFNDSWMHWDPSERARGQRTRDAWMKDTHRAMGWLAPHNRYVHLYLNGLYWGVYDVTERPDAAFASSYLGGNREDYDVINENQVKDGTLDTFRRMQQMRNLASSSQYEELRKHLDVPHFIDYLILNYYAGNIDWGEYKNWYAIRRREPPGQFRYIVWDAERILEESNDDVIRRPKNAPLRLAQMLMANAEFRREFSERARKHCFDGGALTPKASAERWMKRANEIDLAIIAESARWGYYRGNPVFTRDREWLAEQRRLIHHYFPRRTEVFLRQLREVGLYMN